MPLLAWQLSGLESGLLYLACGVFAGASLAGVRVVRGKGKGRGVGTMFPVGLGALTLLVGLLLIREGGVALTQRYGVLLLSALVLGAAAWGIHWRRRMPLVPAVAAPTVCLLLLFAVLLASRTAGSPGPDLRTGQLVHIFLALLGLAAFTFAAGVSAYYLWQIRTVKANPRLAVARTLPPLETLDRVNILAVLFGFSFFALSVVGGWLFVARSSEPLRWWLDPTVLASMSGLAVYLLLFAVRGFLGWHGRKVAILTLVGFVVLVVGFVVAAFCTSANVMHAS